MHEKSSLNQGEPREDTSRRPVVGEDLDENAQIWDIYVEETDRSDKELVKEWSDSLDVLLNSAYEMPSDLLCRLVIESSHQLQPDPAETSAQTLLFISKALVAISKNQPVEISSISEISVSDFSPSYNSVVVNTFWFLSLGLSVAVSLVAMLSKSWCNAFMSKRAGMKYQQGRRRQEKWNGIELWGMQNVFVYLPLLMHVALLLFFIGLALYLWGISISVASPIVALAVVSVLVYIIVTILPLVSDNCPFSTPLSKPIQGIPHTVKLLGKLIWNFLRFLYLGIMSIRARLVVLPMLALNQYRLAIQKMRRFGYQNRSLLRSILGADRGVPEVKLDALKVNPTTTLAQTILMDDTTCQMILWLIQNCDDQRILDTAIQSLAGARRKFPRAPLVENNVIELLVHRLDNCFMEDSGSHVLCLRPSYSINNVLLYIQALRWLMTSDASYGLPFDAWSKESGQTSRIFLQLEPNKTLIDFYWRFAQRSAFLGESQVDADLAAAVASIMAPVAHHYKQMPLETKGAVDIRTYWRIKELQNIESNPSLSRQLDAIFIGHNAIVNWIKYFVSQPTKSNSAALLVLLEAVPHRIIGTVNEQPIRQQSELVILLIELVHNPSCSSPKLKHAIGLSLLVFAMCIYPLPGWKRPLNCTSDYKSRAIEVFNHHQASRYEHSSSLVAFGLLGMLGLGTYSFSDADITVISNALKELGYIATTQPCIHTLPHSLDFKEAAAVIMSQHIRAVLEAKSPHHETVVARILWTLSGVTSEVFQMPDLELVIKLLCTAEHTELRRVCSRILNLSQKVYTKMTNSHLEAILGGVSGSATFDKLVRLSLGQGDVFIAPSIMSYLWEMLSYLIYEVVLSVNDSHISGLCEMVLKSEAVPAYISTRLASLSPDEWLGALIDMWYPLLQEMCGWKSSALAVEDSKILHLANDPLLFILPETKKIGDLLRSCEATLGALQGTANVRDYTRYASIIRYRFALSKKLE
ncbi:phosphatidylinositol phosphatase PTPRQ [Ceratobasidium sp. AG-Ba]|nr:phosphatidylinositol phosphatase PTPRQ [Ceratobasidium sp. AG-Ba]